MTIQRFRLGGMVHCVVAAMLLSLSFAALAKPLTVGVHPLEPAPQFGEILQSLDAKRVGIVIREYADQAQMISELQQGVLDAALISAPKQPLTGIRLIGNLYPSVLHILHRNSLADKTLPELLVSGSIWAGGRGSAGEQLVEDLVADYALAREEVRLLSDPISQTPDVWIVFGGILNNDALSRLQDFSLYPFGASDSETNADIARGMVLRHPTLHTMTLPAQLYPTLGNRPVTTVAVNSQLVVGEHLAIDDAYMLAELAHRARPVLAASYPFVGLEDESLQQQTAHALPLHRGALRFVERHEPSFLERYAEVFAFLLTMLVALASAAVALHRYRQQRRKDRLDRFFERLLEQRSQLDHSDKATAHANIRTLQSEVVALVVEERIDADGALLAFLTLSNQLLLESAVD